MKTPQGCAAPVFVSVPSTDRADKISTSQLHHIRDSKATNYLTNAFPSKGFINSEPELKTQRHLRDRWLLIVIDGERQWSYQIAWTNPELLALKALARNRISALNLNLTDPGPPVGSRRLHQLYQYVVAAAAARAEALAGGAV